MTSQNILVVSRNLRVQRAIAAALRRSGLAPVVASSVSEADSILNRYSVSLVFCSDELPNDGIDEIIQQISKGASRIPLVVVSRFSEWRRLSSFLQRGALDCVLYPMSQVELERVVHNALALEQLRKAQRAPRVASAGPIRASRS